MGDMTDMSLDMISSAEYERDVYVSGGVDCNEAYDLGILDETGCEVGMGDAWARASIGSLDSINTELKIATLEFDSSANKSNYVPVVDSLNEKAIANLLNDKPTCNTCEKIMSERSGKFGKFYFCKCPKQSTVSDNYWQKIKVKYET